MIDVWSLSRAGGFLINDRRFGDWVNQASGDWSGVYYLRCNDSRGVPMQIERRKAPNPDGIVYIGGAISLIDRVSKARRSICAAAHEYGYTDWRVHQLGKRFWVHPELFDIYPFESVYIDVWWFPDFKLDQR